jgi:hypothetical protein
MTEPANYMPEPTEEEIRRIREEQRRTRREQYEDLPYEITDPKHPDHHEVMSEIWDSREGK